MSSQPLGRLQVVGPNHPHPSQDASRPPHPNVQTCTQSNAPDRTSGQMRAAEGVNRKEQ